MQNGNPREMMRQCLLAYHSIFPTTTHVLCHWFATCGGGYTWTTDGKLMAYEMLSEDEITQRIEETAQTIRGRARNVVDGRLAASYDLVRRQSMRDFEFVLDNVEAILSSEWCVPHIEGRAYTSYLTTHAGVTYTNAFNFPDNIDKEWAELLYRFLGWWNVRLNMEYGVGSDRDYEKAVSHWPEHATKVREAIKAAKHKLFPIFNDGLTMEEHNKQMTELIQEIMRENEKNRKNRV